MNPQQNIKNLYFIKIDSTLQDQALSYEQIIIMKE